MSYPVVAADPLFRARRCCPFTCGYGEGNCTLLEYSCLENPLDGGAWWAAVHGVAKSRTRLSDFTFTFHLRALEKEMATHSSVLAWRIPEMGEPGGLPSMGSHRVGQDWSDLAAAAAVEQAGGVPGPDFISSGPGVSNRKWQAISASNHKAQCDFRKAIAEGHTVWICSFFVFLFLLTRDIYRLCTWEKHSVEYPAVTVRVWISFFISGSSSSAAYSLSPSPHQF